MRSLSLLCLVLIASAAYRSASAAEPVRFARDIRPILSDACYSCHGPDPAHREAGLRLDVQEAAASVIAPGDPQASELIRRITSEDTHEVMPPPDAPKKLSAEEKEVLVRWVAEGAQWTRHWSFLPPVEPAVPETGPAIHHPIDAFVARRLAEHSMEFSPEAEREELIRRVTFDLTGLPPTLEEIDAFLNDSSADAYESVVDRLLASPRFGQRMAMMWLDAARYGDTSVYHADGPREMWAWRDAIVDAYNENLPFDQFSIRQIAGDLVPHASLQQQILAGFNRNNGTTDEGGAIAEEYRVEYAVDRVRTTSMVWLGLTMECAQCHDHKYDPISQKDYYRFYTFFNVSSDAGVQTRKGNAEPVLAIPKPEKKQQLPAVEQDLDRTRAEMDSIESDCQRGFDAWLSQQRDAAEAQSAVLSECLVNVPLAEAQGSKVADTAADSPAGAVQGEATWVNSRHDWALRFDGTNYVDLGDVADFQRTDSFSYGGWVKPQKRATGALLARMDDGQAHRGFDMLVGDGPVSVHLINTWPGNAVKVVTKKQLKPDQWQHVMVTYDGSSSAAGIEVFVDGERWECTVEQDGLTGSIRTDKTLLIGSRHPGSRLKGAVDQVQVYGRKLAGSEVKALAKAPAILASLAIEPVQRSQQHVQSLRQHYLSTEHAEYRSLQRRAASLSDRIAELKEPLTTVMIMKDMEDPRETFVLERGAYDSPTDQKVQAGTPSVLPPMADDAPQNRLGLARWLFRDDHPLTARVAVNRYWQMLFGTGLVETPGDFGAQGGFPSHPELLDWLAVDFRQHGWDIKRCLKQIVMSRTYRQRSQASVEAFQVDPKNRWLGRGPRFRLQGEFIRDAALAVSGLLVRDFGGPGVKPYQPPGLWAEVGLGGKPKFAQDHGEKLYRRSLYTYWKRSAPPPAMQIFDAPTREKCTLQRARTNTPLQALVTLNDAQFVEAARHFAERMMSEGGDAIGERIEHGFRLATARRPQAAEQEVLRHMLDAAAEQYRADPDAASELLAVGESPRNESLDPARHAAWTVVASAILNLDETLTRE